jgi:hypothetical protein
MDHRNYRAIVIENRPVLRVTDMPRASFRLDVISLHAHLLTAFFVKGLGAFGSR